VVSDRMETDTLKMSGILSNNHDIFDICAHSPSLIFLESRYVGNAIYRLQHAHVVLFGVEGGLLY
jgi:hypothetical protein